MYRYLCASELGYRHRRLVWDTRDFHCVLRNRIGCAAAFPVTGMSLPDVLPATGINLDKIALTFDIHLVFPRLDTPLCP